MAFDLIIKDGTVIDGTGSPRFRADIGVSGGLIQEIGRPSLPIQDAKTVVLASGKLVTPGFIDITSHADANWSLFLNPRQDYLLTQGVTTILVGNCGSSLAPLVSRDAVSGLEKWDHVSESNINWLGVGEFLDELGRRPLGVNVATLMGHGTIRRGVLKGESRPLGAEEFRQAVHLIRQGMGEGAFGLSFGLVYSHEAVASRDELAALASAAAESGGVCKVHLRNEGINLLPAVNEVLQLGRASQSRIIVSHLKAIGRKAWRSFGKVLEIIDRGRASGLDISFDISPYQRTGSFLYVLLPPWAREGGFEQMFGRIQDAEARKKIIADLESQTLHYDRLVVATSRTPNTNGRNIQELARRAGKPPAETLLDLLIANQGRVNIFGATVSFGNLIQALAHPVAMMASDGSGVTAELGLSGRLVHPRSTGAFAHFLHKFVKERGLMSWEEGIRKITSFPAEAVGIKNRGRIAPGLAADIAVFDPESIRDHSTYQNPYAHSTGIEVLMVNGALAIENSELTGAFAGQVLKKS